MKKKKKKRKKTKTSNDSPSDTEDAACKTRKLDAEYRSSDIQRHREKKKGLSEQDLVALEYIFGETNLGRALDVASSRGGVTRFIGKKSRRTVYAVKATTTTTNGGGGGGGGMNGGAAMNDATAAAAADNNNNNNNI